MKLVDGYTLMHEHINIDLSSVKKDDDCKLDCIDEIIEEYKELYQSGVRNIVEVTNIGMGRDLETIKRVSLESKINIITSTGLYKEPFIPEDCLNKTSEELAEIFINELNNVDEKSGYQAHMIGEIGTSKNEWKDSEKRLFKAAAIAHNKTQAPIYTHTTLGTLAFEQVMFFKEANVDLSKVIIGHIDLANDIELIKKVIQAGANVGFDTIGKNNYLPDETRVQFLKTLQDENMIDHVVLSMDITRKNNMKYRGGIGYNFLFTNFIPMLKEAGVTDESINKMLVINPRRILINE